MTRIYINEIRIKENKIYGKSLVNNLLNKYKDNSPELIKKINIAGLFRDYFGNIQNIDKKTLLEKYKEWYEKTVEFLTKSTAFYNNEYAAKLYLNAYIDNIGSLGDKARPFHNTKNSIEKDFVDVINNNNWIKDEKGKIATDKLPIYNPEEKDLLYEDDNIIIIDGRSKDRCIKYGESESWCISRRQGNYYSTYRLQKGTSIYFVLQKNEKYPLNKIVILNWGRGNYAIADQTNSGNRSGTNTMSWSGIEKELPNLKGLEKYFEYFPVTNSERAFEALINNYDMSSDEPISSMITNIYKDIPQPHTYSEEDVLLAYVVRMEDKNEHFTVENLENASVENISTLIEIPYFFSIDTLFTSLNEKQRSRFYRRLKGTDMFEKFMASLNLSSTNENKFKLYKDIFLLTDYNLPFFYNIYIDVFYEYQDSKYVLNKILANNNIITNGSIVTRYIRNDKKGDFVSFLMSNNILMIDTNIITTLQNNGFDEKDISNLLENFIEKLSDGELTKILGKIQNYTYTDIYSIYKELVRRNINIDKIPYKKIPIETLNFVNQATVDKKIAGEDGGLFINFLRFLLKKRICAIRVTKAIEYHEMLQSEDSLLLFKELMSIINETNDWKTYLVQHENLDNDVVENNIQPTVIKLLKK